MQISPEAELYLIQPLLKNQQLTGIATQESVRTIVHKSRYLEEGRAVRGSAVWLKIFTIVWLAVSCFVGYTVFEYFVRGNFTPLQRVYFIQFRRSAMRSYLGFRSGAMYVTLERTRVNPQTGKVEHFFCLERDLVPALDEEGKVQLTRDRLPDFRYTGELGRREQFLWNRALRNDDFMYHRFTNLFYDGTGFFELFYAPIASGSLSFFGGLAAAVWFNKRKIKQRLKGSHLRGTRELSPREYESKMCRADGIGLEVFEVRERG